MDRRIFLPALHSVLDDFRGFDNAFNNLYAGDEIKKMPHYNIEEDEKSYCIEMDMPGVKKEDLDIGIKENILSISAKRKKVKKSENGESKEEVVSSYEQSFNISTKGIDVENIEANLNNGVLKVILPKKEELKFEKKINIE
ncbi:Hsp20/alpha crystallin family protein [Brachyspira innocens]|uniref:Hsp20/alpha crystallin family protein n=1 Tax=Brachyspira innocens TaxID=13264 RepID=A0ABT8YX05_9SPIR|nr:Hsp20/alpha crystallin family protein [Brachyspira innocens]MDO6994169.1 Hsp20/alpha crystallin family protein [Brachyspira innocens]MDO7019758.1 Hsp20/alpha crystallin family protein [Brachyspira innocens]